MSKRIRRTIGLLGLAAGLAGCMPGKEYTPYRPPQDRILEVAGRKKDLARQRELEGAIAELDRNCVACHQHTTDPHTTPEEVARGETGNIQVACVDCHGGNPRATTKEEAHPKPRLAERWPSSRNPEDTYAFLNEESWEWIRFVNPADLRVANTTCGPCHPRHVLNVTKSLMATSAHFWGAAGYCNGIVPLKRTIFGESYSPEGIAQKVNAVPPPSEEEIYKHSEVPWIVPLPHWEVTQPGNIFRVFEKGSRLGGVALGLNGAPLPLVGLPDKLEDPGRPNNRLSDRGLGTLNRVDLPLLNVHKTRLNDPFLFFMGTNDHPGDYRSSGCAACHVVYANDRSPVHSGPYARYGHRGLTSNPDPTIPKDEPGHPIAHRFTNAIPSSQCMVCHHHQPNSFLNTYFGFQMWSYETDGELMWPEEEREPTHEEFVKSLIHNPEEAAVRGLWGDKEFLENVTDLNPKLKHTQFADYHGHGWIFRAVFKMDRKGNLLDAEDRPIPYDDPDKFKGVVPLVRGEEQSTARTESPDTEREARRAVHLKDIHAERGMHCVDCHYSQDVHGNGRLYAEYQAAIEIACSDCHGTVFERAPLRPSGPASYTSARTPFTRLVTPFGKPRFEIVEGEIYQNSMVDPELRWRVPQVRDSIDPSNPHYNPRAAYAKTQKKGGGWGGVPSSEAELAHRDSQMTCYACHTSWITSCFGCHLPQRANMRTPMRHFESKFLRNFASYNPQVARDDAFMLGIAPDVQGNKISTVRSSSAVMISSEDGQRQKIYIQIPTTAANGMSSQAFNTHYAHAVRKRETRRCDDCHVSRADDNNAWLAQVFLLGTGFVNFMGHYAYVGAGSAGFYAVEVTEWDEPQAVYGSYLHRLAYPERFRRFVEGGRRLTRAVHHGVSEAFPPLQGLFEGGDAGVRSLQLRGEYLYTANGTGGFRVYDVANVANKGFSEKIVTAPVSPLGQDTHIPTRFATAVALPFNNPTSMNRRYRPENREQKYVYRGRVQNLHELYRYAYVTDLYEGLIVIDVDCLTDGDPENNFVRRATTFNPDGALNGARNLAVAGTTVYVCTEDDLVLVDIDDPLAPEIIGRIGAPAIVNPRAVAVQFRYAFVCDAEGMKVIDVTRPRAAAPVPGAAVQIADARDVYVARTYAYVAAGAQGMAIVDVERPAEPKLERFWNAGGLIDDLNQVKVAMTNDSVFAYLADGKNGLRVVQLISPEDTERTKRSAYGFSPRPDPRLIATFPTPQPALAVSRALDRDRAVDESGNQVTVFGRIGGRPLTLEERERLYLRNGELYTVSNEPEEAPRNP